MKCRICTADKPAIEFKHVKAVLVDGAEELDKDPRLKYCCNGTCYTTEKGRLKHKLNDGYKKHQEESERRQDVMASGVAGGAAAAAGSSSSSSSSSSSTGASAVEPKPGGGGRFRIAPSVLLNQCAKNAAQSVMATLADCTRVYSNVPKQTEYVVLVWNDLTKIW